MLRLLFTICLFLPVSALARSGVEYSCQCGAWNNGGWKCDLLKFSQKTTSIVKTSFIWSVWGRDEEIRKFEGQCQADKEMLENETRSGDRCECRVAMVNNGWKEVQFLVFDTDGRRQERMSLAFAPNVSFKEIQEACKKASDLASMNCGEIQPRICSNGLDRCD